jgi:radical SAM protein with 4Fe4S-binding SPASM domain
MKKLIKEIDLYVTNKCNSKCKHCMFSSGEKEMREMKLSEIKKVLIEGKKLGATELHITGGEPLFRKDILEILRISRRLNYYIRFQSNLTLFTESFMKDIKELVNEILTSIDGLEETHDYIRFKGSFKLTTDWIKRLKKEGFRVIVASVISKYNYKDISEIIKLTSSLNVDSHLFVYATPAGNMKKENCLDIKEWREQISLIKKTYKKIKPLMDVTYEENMIHVDDEYLASKNKCRLRLKDHVIVLSNGDIFPCLVFFGTDKRMGNVRKQSLKEIWENSPMWKFYDKDPKECINCKRYNKCKAGCKGYSGLFGKFGEKDPRCTNDNYFPGCPLLTVNLKGNISAPYSRKILTRIK